jgi:hypothetical protein
VGGWVVLLGDCVPSLMYFGAALHLHCLMISQYPRKLHLHPTQRCLPARVQVVHARCYAAAAKGVHQAKLLPVKLVKARQQLVCTLGSSSAVGVWL